MYFQNIIPQTDEDIRAFIQEAENHYRNQVLEITKTIAFIPNIKFLLLSGPSCSGKTTTSYILENELEKYGYSVKTISIDDFYRDRDDISDDQTPDFESITAIDFDIFSDCVNKILNGQTAMLPKFDFSIGGRTGFYPYVPNSNEIVVFEGIQTIYPEIVSAIPKQNAKSIYICVDEDITAYGTYFDKRELRFLRRLLRDFLFRNATPSRTLELWEGVVKNEDKNIIPYGKNADFIINSFLSYELNVIKPFILNTIHYDRSLTCEAELHSYLIEKFKNIPEISSHFVPHDSVFREFIGK